MYSRENMYQNQKKIFELLAKEAESNKAFISSCRVYDANEMEITIHFQNPNIKNTIFGYLNEAYNMSLWEEVKTIPSDAKYVESLDEE